MNDPSPQMMNRTYGLWPPPPMPAGDDPSNPFPNLNRPTFAAAGAPNYGRPHWKPNNKGRKPPSGPDSTAGVAGPSYMPQLDHSDAPQQHYQTRSGRPPRRFYKKKHNGNNNNSHHPGAARSAPFAPRNTTSFLIRAKRAGGIASLVSPCPVTPAVLPTPQFSPSREALVETAKEEWGVDGYGSMNGLIRLRSPRTPTAVPPPLAADEDAGDEGSSDSDVEEHVEVERRLDHDLRRFEMVFCPSLTDPEDSRDGSPHPHAHAHEHALGPSFLLGSHVDDQDAHILRLQEENLSLRDRLFLMERDMADMRRRLVMIEMRYRRGSSREDGNSHNNDNNNNNDNTSAVDEMSDSEEAGGVCSEKSVGID